jgi:predicted dehydrogenase
VIRLALIGCGRWGKNYFGASIQSGECKVTRVAGANNGWPNDLPAREWRKLLDAPVDAFVIATPPDSHEEIALELLSRGRPVMIEKPIALSVEATCRITAAAVRAKVPLLVNHIHLFAPAYEALRERVRDWTSPAVIGAGGGPGPVRDYSALWDYGPHDVAMFLGLAQSKPVSHVNADRVGGEYRISLRAGDATGLIRVWNDAEKMRILSVLGPRDQLVTYDDADPASSKLMFDGVPIPVADERPLTRAVGAFARAVRTGQTDWRFDPILAVEVTKVLALADRSASAKEHADGHHC